MLFVMNYKNTCLFKNLYDYIIRGNPPYEHKFIKQYVSECMMQILQSKLIVGRDIEVMNKLSYSYKQNYISDTIIEQIGFNREDL